MMSNNFSAEGRITHLAKQARQVSGKFRVREFVIEIADGKYPQLAKFQLVQDKCDLLDDYALGDEVKVDFNVQGRQSNEGKVFTNLQAWRLSKVGIPQAGIPQVGIPQASAGGFDDDVPF